MAATETSQSPSEKEPVPLGQHRAWWHRHLEPAERRRIMSDLAISQVDSWALRFTIMLTLSIIVAVMGLALNSAAVVIGAMLLAPLMQPVLAAGACMSLALFTKSLQAMFKVMAATAWCIFIAYLISFILPSAPLTAEVLSRTQPGIEDLVVALAAGAAGAYATVRADVSSSLPGVAVAVALVPPLGSVGMALEAGQNSLAFGALLLYMTNLAAILFASIVVFVVTGFVSPRRLSDNRLRLTSAIVAIVAIVIAIAVPLYRASIDSIERGNEQTAAEDIVVNWLGELDRQVEQTVTIRRNTQQVVVEVRGFVPPIDQGPLVAEMLNEFPNYDVAVQWIRSQQATTTTLAPPEPTDQLLEDITVRVEAWLDTTGEPYQIDGVKLDDNLVRIDAAGLGSPPPVNDLVPLLAELDPNLTPALNWFALETITEETAPSPIEVTAEQMRLAAEEWASERGLIVRSFSYDGERIEVEVSGSREPDPTVLERNLLALTEADTRFQVYFTERVLVTTTTSTTTTVAGPDGEVNFGPTTTAAP